MGYTSINPLHGFDSNRGPDVDVSGQRSHANEEPILIEGSKLLVDGRFDEVGPFWDLHLARPVGGCQHYYNAIIGKLH